MTAAVARLDRAVSEAVATRGGVRPVEQGEGDSFVVAFARASDAVGRQGAGSGSSAPSAVGALTAGLLGPPACGRCRGHGRDVRARKPVAPAVLHEDVQTVGFVDETDAPQ
jgi:hypothetical protein